MSDQFVQALAAGCRANLSRSEAIERARHLAPVLEGPNNCRCNSHGSSSGVIGDQWHCSRAEAPRDESVSSTQTHLESLGAFLHSDGQHAAVFLCHHRRASAPPSPTTMNGAQIAGWAFAGSVLSCISASMARRSAC